MSIQAIKQQSNIHLFLPYKVTSRAGQNLQCSVSLFTLTLITIYSVIRNDQHIMLILRHSSELTFNYHFLNQ